MSHQLGDDYERHCNALLAAARRWIAEHPGANPQVQFNSPPSVGVIACISDAIEQHYVSCNAEGLDMLKSMPGWGTRTEATYMMMRAVLETLSEEP